MEAVDQAEEFLEERSLSTYYDEVALPGLQLAQNDVFRKALDRAQTEKIMKTAAEVVEQLSDQEDREPAHAKTPPDAETAAAMEAVPPGTAAQLPVLAKDQLAPEWSGERAVLCIAGHSALDEAVGLMLAQLLQKHGLGAQSAGSKTLSGANLLGQDPAGVAMVCLSYLDTTSLAHIRYALRRVHRTFPTAKIMVGCWMQEGNELKAVEALKPDALATTLRQALQLSVDAARDARAVSAPELAHDPATARLAAVGS
jgi:hypothetical protein